jgi:hypothetical protein
LFVKEVTGSSQLSNTAVHATNVKWTSERDLDHYTKRIEESNSYILFIGGLWEKEEGL